MEIELKFLVNPADVDQLMHHPLLLKYAITELSDQELVTTYFDTPDLQVQRHNASLRVRHVNRAWIQALKCGGEVNAGLHQRHEWETPVAGPALDLPALRQLVDKHDCGGKLIRDQKVMQHLESIFTTKVTRTIRYLRLPGGLEVECALDQGIIEYGAFQEPICELELERTSGDARLLLDFAIQLLDNTSMRLGNRSKAERGYLLYNPQLVIPPAGVQLTPGMTVEQCFQKIVTACIARIQQNEPGVVEQHAPEAVHQMRVGMRRLRCALRLFENVVPPHDEMAQEFRWFAEQLGAARDWDVLSDATLPTVLKKSPPDTGLAPLQDAAIDIAREKREAAAQAIASAKFAQLILRFTRWVLRAGWRDGMSDDEIAKLTQPVSKFADRMLAKNKAKLLERGKRLQGADVPTRHRVRIAAKNSRYATEFFQSLYRSRQLRRYVGALSTLQDELGGLNDAAVADDLLRELGVQQGLLAALTGYARCRLSLQAQREKRKLRKLWKRFTPVPVPSRKPS